jgi:hypothetical protein
MSEIQVVDNFLSNDDIIKVIEHSRNFKWKFGKRTLINKGYKFWVCVLYHDDLFKTYIFPKIEEYFKKKFTILKIYANGQTYGQDGEYHIDSPKDDDYTFLLYLGDITHRDVSFVDGYTLFKQGEKVTCIEPICNRCVLFKSNIEHKGMAPSRKSNVLRTIIAFKLREII